MADLAHEVAQTVLFSIKSEVHSKGNLRPGVCAHWLVAVVRKHLRKQVLSPTDILQVLKFAPDNYLEWLPAVGVARRGFNPWQHSHRVKAVEAAALAHLWVMLQPAPTLTLVAS